MLLLSSSKIGLSALMSSLIGYSEVLDREPNPLRPYDLNKVSLEYDYLNVRQGFYNKDTYNLVNDELKRDLPHFDILAMNSKNLDRQL